MLKVAFPVGEFFHEHHCHHSAEEMCTLATGQECHHEAHFSHSHKHHHDCIFHQLHTFFIQSYFIYSIPNENSVVEFFTTKDDTTSFDIYISTRGPPSQIIS